MTISNRTVEELNAAIEAQGFAWGLKDATPPKIVVHKGDPQIFVCSEPAMTLRTSWPATADLPARVQISPAAVLGPVARMAIAWHIGATPEEAERCGMTAAAAQVALREHIANALRKAGLPVGPIEDIGPSDPRWGRP